MTTNKDINAKIAFQKRAIKLGILIPGMNGAETKQWREDHIAMLQKQIKRKQSKLSL